MRGHRFLAVADALADHDRADQRGHRGVDVHHGAAGEVERTLGEEEAGRCVKGRRTAPEPHHVRHRQVGEGEPQRREHQQGGELDPLGQGAND